MRWVGPALLAALVAIAGARFHALWRVHADDPHWRSGLETVVTAAGLGAFAMLVPQFRRRRHIRELVLLTAILAAGATSFVFNTLPGYGYELNVYGAGARAAVALLVAAAFVTIAVVPASARLAQGRRLTKLAVPAAIGWIELGELVDLVTGPVRAGGPAGAYHAVSVALAIIGFTSLMVAASKLYARHRDGEPAAGLLAGAALLLGLAQLARPTIAVEPSAWLTTADLLRAGTWILLLASAAELLRVSQVERSHQAVMAERQRIARDLHDGLAQDLAFIAAHSGRFAREYGSDHPLTVAAQRALAASRGTIVDLEAGDAASTEAALRVVGAELARRFAITVTVRVDGNLPADYSEADRHELVRIAREAIANAARHGGARHVDVRLGSRGTRLLLRVSDDGCGVGKASPHTAGTGLGMRAMRDRARRLNADVSLGPGRPGETVLDVVSSGRRLAAH